MAKLRIFISYRRSDLLAKGTVGRIFEHLSKTYGQDRVFMDVDKMRTGQDFRSVLFREVGGADVLLAVIGPQWLESMVEKKDDPNDWVRLEIESALAQRIPVAPVLLGDTQVPREHDLPPSLASLAYLHASIVNLDRHFARDMARLAQDLVSIARTRRRAAPASELRGAGMAPLAKKGFPFGIMLGAAAVMVISAVVALIWISQREPEPPTVPYQAEVPQPPVAVIEAPPVPAPVPPTPKPIGVEIEEAAAREPAPMPKSVFPDEPFNNSLGMRFVPVERAGVLFSIWETRVRDYQAYALSAPGVEMAGQTTDGSDQSPDCPIVNVSWDDAVRFCAWLSEKEGRTYRLPTYGSRVVGGGGCDSQLGPGSAV